MIPPIDLAGRTVLVHSPQPGIAERLHRLIEAGGRVTVWSGDPAAEIVDIADRGLVSLVPDADPNAYDIVLRDRVDRAEHIMTRDGVGSVTLVGGGPGDMGLLTIAGMQAIRDADVIVCDRLAPLAALAEARTDAEVIHVGKIPRGEFTPQEQINALLVAKARAGLNVVRFKGGDSFVFGRGGEEWIACSAAGIPVRSIPGVSSSIAAAELAGIPVTHRSVTQGFVVVSGHVGPADPRNTVDWAALASSGLTIVVMMGVAALGDIVGALTEAGMPTDTPAACIADASLPTQRAAVATLADIAEHADAQGIAAPAVTIIGPVVAALRS